jgi:hypothetical protein
MGVRSLAWRQRTLPSARDRERERERERAQERGDDESMARKNQPSLLYAMNQDCGRANLAPVTAYSSHYISKKNGNIVPTFYPR